MPVGMGVAVGVRPVETVWVGEAVADGDTGTGDADTGGLRDTTDRLGDSVIEPDCDGVRVRDALMEAVMERVCVLVDALERLMDGVSDVVRVVDGVGEGD